jgi:polyketide cyclase/dehydrase/lipid transport protein
VAQVSESVLVGASLAATWDQYFDPQGWSAWVEGFERVERSEGYPETGGTLVWQSNPAGRGTVTERVLDHEPRTLHRIAFEDPQSSGELTTRFAIEGEGTRVTLELTYTVGGGGALAHLTDMLFARGQVIASLRRTLMDLRFSVEERP